MPNDIKLKIPAVLHSPNSVSCVHRSSILHLQIAKEYIQRNCDH